MQPATRNEQPATSNESAFTLLEVLIVLFILGMIAVMAWPALGILDDRAREELTCENMEVIRRAIVGDPDRFDADGRRIIGGYVGDMEKWPDLWEAKAEMDHDDGNAYCTCDDGVKDFSFGYRPIGKFVEKRWKWCRPFRKVLDYTDHRDHIGGLETENEGQPRALWTRDLNEHPNPADMIAEGDSWKGPYMAPPMDECLKDSDHWAETCNEYMSLEPIDGWVPNPDPPPPDWIRISTWEDGDYAPADGALGEHYDEKESFRLLQTDGRLTDGWGRALRFFITADQDRPGSTIFWIISEGPDKEGTYPTKGTFGGTTWSSNPDDIMSKAYDDEDEYNKDNIVMKIYSHEWEAIFDEINEQKKTETENLFLRIKKAILGSSPGGMNDGFTGDVCRWPKRFRWEDNGTPADSTDDYWDDKDESATPVPYTKGQLRELWTRTPHIDPLDPLDPESEADNVDEWASTYPGIGWRHAYFQTPWGFNGEQFIRDAWDREVLFFFEDNLVDDSKDAIMILSRGADGKFDFGDTGGNYLEPANYTEELGVIYDPADSTTYNPNKITIIDTVEYKYNADNVVLIIWESDWYPGFFTLKVSEKFTVLNATIGVTKARFFYDNIVPDDTKVADTTDGSMVDADLDGTADDWEVSFNYTDDPMDPMAPRIRTGSRYLFFWDDVNVDGIIDASEDQYTAIYNIITSEEPRDGITLDADSGF